MEREADKRSPKVATAKGVSKGKRFSSFFTTRINNPLPNHDKGHNVELLETVVEGSTSLNESSFPWKPTKEDNQIDTNRVVGGSPVVGRTFQRNFKRRGKGLSQWRQLEELPFNLQDYKDNPAETESNLSLDISGKTTNNSRNGLASSTVDIVCNSNRDKVPLGIVEASKKQDNFDKQTIREVSHSNQGQATTSSRESCHIETFKSDFKVERSKFFQLDPIAIEEKPRKSTHEIVETVAMVEVEKHDENIHLQLKKPISLRNKTVQTVNPSSFNFPSSPTEKLLKILLIGDPGVGKTSFVQRYTNDIYKPDLKGTVGVDFSLKVLRVSKDLTCKLQLWDVAGQERFTWMTRVYYKDAKGCIIFFDLGNRSSFMNVIRWKKDLDSKCTLRDGTSIPCLLLANKCDLKDRVVDSSEIETVYKKHNFIGWTETSAKDDMMVRDSMKFLVDTILRRESSFVETYNPLTPGLRRHTSVVKLTGGDGLKNKTCKMC